MYREVGSSNPHWPSGTSLMWLTRLSSRISASISLIESKGSQSVFMNASFSRFSEAMLSGRFGELESQNVTFPNTSPVSWTKPHRMLSCMYPFIMSARKCTGRFVLFWTNIEKLSEAENLNYGLGKRCLQKVFVGFIQSAHFCISGLHPANMSWWTEYVLAHWLSLLNVGIYFHIFHVCVVLA